MVLKRRLRAAARTLLLLSTMTGGLLVWMSTSRSFQETKESSSFSLQTTDVRTNGESKIRRWGGLNSPEKKWSRERRNPIEVVRPSLVSVSRNEAPGAVRIFRRSGKVLFSSQTTAQRTLIRPGRTQPPHSRAVAMSKSFSFQTDVFVFLHIQKTGGTALELHLLDIKS